jgi:FMN phosphatase YigB (HAD superfamily)
MPRQITAIALDLGNVLVRVDHLRFCRGLAALTQRSPQEVYTAVFESGLEPGYDTGRLSSRDYYLGIMNRLRLSLPYPRFCRLWCDIFDPMEGMEELVAHLAERFPLFLLSNTNPLHFASIQERFPGLLRPFQAFILSYQVGSRKPEGEIYQALIRQANQDPGQILYLDDQLPLVEAAREQGLRAWHFTSPEDFRQEMRRHGLSAG